MRLCSFPGCERKHDSRGYCSSHALQLRKHGEVKPLRARLAPPDDGLCTFEGCEALALAKTLCNGHYTQIKQGRPLAEINKYLRLKKDNLPWHEEARLRILQYVAIEGECLVWRGTTTGRGYGTLTIGDKRWSVHRLAYCMVRQDINACKNQTVHHACSNSLCINPMHLQLATHRENVGEMFARKDFLAIIASLKAEIVSLKNEIEQLKQEKENKTC